MKEKKVSGKAVKKKDSPKTFKTKKIVSRPNMKTKISRPFAAKQKQLPKRKAAPSLTAPTRYKKFREEFTGRFFVVFNAESSDNEILAEARRAKLNLIPAQSAWNGQDQYVAQLLEHTDGLIFGRLKVAFINLSAADQLDQWQKTPHNHIVSVQLERFLYGIHAKARSSNTAGSSFADSMNATWGIHAINAASETFTGKGVKMAILDTGMDLTHPDFVHRNIHYESFVGTKDANDGHGTHCVGIACGNRQRDTGLRYGVAHGARFM